MFHSAFIGQTKHVHIVAHVQPTVQAFLLIGDELPLVCSKQGFDLPLQGHSLGQLLEILICFVVVIDSPLIPVVAHLFDVADVAVALPGAELHGHNNHVCGKAVGFVDLNDFLNVGAVYRPVQDTLHAGKQKPQLFVVRRHPGPYLSPAEHRRRCRGRRPVL